MLPVKVKKRNIEARSITPRSQRLWEVFARSRLRKYEGRTSFSRLSGTTSLAALNAAPPIDIDLVIIRGRVSKELPLVEKKLRDLVTPAEMKRWLNARNVMLQGRTPLEAILQGDTSRVLELLAQLEEGIYV